MTMTIKELADELGVTKQTVQYHFRSLPTNTYFKNDKGVYTLKTEAIAFIKEKISPFAGKETDKKATKETVLRNDILINQLNIKDNQISELLASQNQLQKLLDQQQVLTLQANKKILELETSLSEVEEENSNAENFSEEVKEKNLNEVLEIHQEKKSFWQRLFNQK